MTSHATRQHAPWAPSSNRRLIRCALAYTASQGLESAEGQAAAWGTTAHTIAERAIRQRKPCSTWLGERVRTKRHTILVDAELCATAQVHVDYVNGLGADETHIEQRLSLAPLDAPVESFGTCDVNAWTESVRRREIVDFKGGRGLVEVPGNDQLYGYALMALLADTTRVPDVIRLTIVQPRAEHPDGYIRSVDIDPIELVTWSITLIEAMRAALAPDPQPTPGDWCQFCPAAAKCPGLRDRALAVAGASFGADGAVRLDRDPKAMTPEALARVLDNADLLTGWLNSVRSWAHAQAERGVEIPGYQVVLKTKNRVWTNEAAAAAKLRELGLTDDTIFARTLCSPAQADKALGAKRKAEVEHLWEKPSTGETNLVRADRSARAAAPTLAERHFDLLP